jgi:TorA maturation chaperone TorD
MRQFAADSQKRMVWFKLFAETLVYPDDLFWEQATSGLLLQAFDDALELLSSVRASAILREWRPLRKKYVRFSARDFQELRVDYTRMFYIERLVSPYGAAYSETHSGEESRVMGIYRNAGLRRQEGLTERADHIALECDYFYYLAYREQYSWQHGDAEGANGWASEAADFWDFHLGPLAAGFSAGLASSTRCGFYSVLASMLEAADPLSLGGDD